MCTAYATPLDKIQLNEHLNAVSGEIMNKMVRNANQVGIEDGSSSHLCIRGIMKNIYQINEVNDKEIQECISVEERKIQVNNATFTQTRRNLDKVTETIIKKLKNCVVMKDHVDSTECSARIESLNNDLTDNSGLAVKAYQNMTTETSNNRAEREDCVDKSIRVASKKISNEQKKIGICLNSKM